MHFISVREAYVQIPLAIYLAHPGIWEKSESARLPKKLGICNELTLVVLRRGPAEDGGDSPQRTAQQMLSASQLQSLAHGLFPPDEGTVVDWSVAARTIYIYYNYNYIYKDRSEML